MFAARGLAVGGKEKALGMSGNPIGEFVEFRKERVEQNDSVHPVGNASNREPECDRLIAAAIGGEDHGGLLECGARTWVAVKPRELVDGFAQIFCEQARLPKAAAAGI